MAWAIGAAAAEEGGPARQDPESHGAGAVRMELREQEAALTQLVTIVDALEKVAPQRAAVNALLGDSAAAERIRAALAEIDGAPRAAPVAPARRQEVRTAWLPDATAVEYVQGEPPRVLLRHGSGRRIALAPGAPRLVGGDRIVLEAVTVGGDGRARSVSLTVNGRALELGTR